MYGIPYTVFHKKTWRALRTEGKEHSGYEMIDVKQLQCHVPTAAIFIGIDKATVFHRKDKLPIIGFQVAATFFLFWIDKTFKAYNHGNG